VPLAGLPGGEHAAGVGEHGDVEPLDTGGADRALGVDEHAGPQPGRSADHRREGDRLVAGHLVDPGGQHLAVGGATSTSSVPPQVRPTAKASSSL
jgi:hypothetical protein